jgi:hypothetical protein
MEQKYLSGDWLVMKNHTVAEFRGFCSGEHEGKILIQYPPHIPHGGTRYYDTINKDEVLFVCEKVDFGEQIKIT